mgnify:CR=1 FL=1
MSKAPAFTALQVMQDAPVIPVIVLNDVAHAVPMAKALVAGGVRMLEVTLRTPQALACIEAIAKAVPEAVVGAGTIRSKADAQAAADGDADAAGPRRRALLRAPAAAVAHAHAGPRHVHRARRHRTRLLGLAALQQRRSFRRPAPRRAYRTPSVP